MPGVVRDHHIGLLALLRSSRAHNSLLSICRARHAPDVRGMQQADVMVRRSNASGCGNVAAIKTARQVLGAVGMRDPMTPRKDGGHQETGICRLMQGA